MLLNYFTNSKKNRDTVLKLFASDFFFKVIIKNMRFLKVSKIVIKEKIHWSEYEVSFTHDHHVLHNSNTK